MGRPRLLVDFAIVLRMRDKPNLGWSKMAEEYRKFSGEYISRDTMKRRYFEVKRQVKDFKEVAADESIS
jgi:hypothetical protein